MRQQEAQVQAPPVSNELFDLGPLPSPPWPSRFFRGKKKKKKTKIMFSILRSLEFQKVSRGDVMRAGREARKL